MNDAADFDGEFRGTVAAEKRGQINNWGNNSFGEQFPQLLQFPRSVCSVSALFRGRRSSKLIRANPSRLL
jgi:hypothetical protein